VTPFDSAPRASLRAGGRGYRLAACAVTLGVLTFVYRYLSFEEFPNDHYMHLAIAQQITRGGLGVRDYVELGIPLMTMLSAWAQLGLGEGLRSELILIALMFAVAASLTVLTAAWLGRSPVVGVLAALVPVLATPVSYSYPKLLAPAIGFLAALGYSRQPTRLNLWLVAAAIAGAFLLRHDLGMFVGTGVVALLVAQYGITREGLLETGRVGLASLLLVSPFFLWVQVYQGIGDYVRQGLAISRREAQRSTWWQPPRFGVDSGRPFLSRLAVGPVVNVRWQPDATEAAIVEAEQRHGLVRLELNSPRSWSYELRGWSARDLEALVRDPLAADTHGIDRTNFALQVPAPQGFRALLVHVYGPGEGLRLTANALSAMLYLVWLLPAGAIAALVFTWRQSSPQLRGMVAMVVVVQLAMNFSMLRDPLSTRARDVMVPTALLLSYLGGLAWSAAGGGWFRHARRGLVLAALVMVIASAGSLGAAPRSIEVTQVARGVSGLRERARTIRRRFAPPDQRTGPRSPVYHPIVNYIVRCTAPDARLLTLTFAPELFFYTGRQFAGGQATLSPGYFTAEQDADDLLRRLSAEDVPLVITDSQTQQEMLDDYPRIGAHVRRHYHEAERFAISDDKSFVVWVENGRPACARLE
jgi:hypothetical protein